MATTIRVTLEDAEGWEEEVDLPAKWEICPRCDGDGTHDHPAFSNGITSDEWAEWGDEDRETYMCGGYDVHCEECKGSGTVLVVDDTRVPSDLRERYGDWSRGQADLRAENAYYQRCRERGMEF